MSTLDKPNLAVAAAIAVAERHGLDADGEHRALVEQWAEWIDDDGEFWEWNFGPLVDACDDRLHREFPASPWSEEEDGLRPEPSP